MVRHSRRSALPEPTRRPSQQPPPSPTDRHTPANTLHPKSLVNSRDLSSNTRDLSYSAHTSTREFAAPLPSRKSPKILQILLQTTPPTQITAHPQYPKNHSSDNGQTLARPLVCSRRPSHPENPPKSCKSCFRQPAQLKSQPIPNIPKITVQTTVKHSPGHSSVRGAPPILKIPQNPANPASDNPPNSNHSPSPISHDLLQAVSLSTIHYPLVFTKNQKLKTES